MKFFGKEKIELRLIGYLCLFLLLFLGLFFLYKLFISLPLEKRIRKINRKIKLIDQQIFEELNKD